VFALHPNLLRCAEAHHLVTRDGFAGFDFNEDRDGTWFEGSGQMSVAYSLEDLPGESDRYSAMLRVAQQMPPPIGNGLGTTAAARDAISSGFGFKLFRRLHIGATAWSVFAQLGHNPYFQRLALRLHPLEARNGSFYFRFPAKAEIPYRLEQRDSLAAGQWTTLISIPPVSVGTNLSVAVPLSGSQRFYRIVSP